MRNHVEKHNGALHAYPLCLKGDGGRSQVIGLLFVLASDLILSNFKAFGDKSLNCWKVGCIIKATWSILKRRVPYGEMKNVRTEKQEVCDLVLAAG